MEAENEGLRLLKDFIETSNRVIASHAAELHRINEMLTAAHKVYEVLSILITHSVKIADRQSLNCHARKEHGRGQERRCQKSF